MDARTFSADLPPSLCSHASGLCSGAALLSSALGVLEYCRLFVAPRHAAHAAAFRERLLCSGMDACSAGIILLAPISLCGRVGHTGRGTCSSSGLLPSGCLFLAAVQARTEKYAHYFYRTLPDGAARRAGMASAGSARRGCRLCSVPGRSGFCGLSLSLAALRPILACRLTSCLSAAVSPEWNLSFPDALPASANLQ